MFTYCENNPIIRIDSTGYCYYTAGGVWAHDAWENLGGYEKKPDPGYYQGTTPTGLDVYVAPDNNYSTTPQAVKIVDKRDTNTFNGMPNPDIQILDAYKYTERSDQVGIITLINTYAILNPSTHVWKRSQPSLIIEWDLHNFLYGIFRTEQFKNADFDKNDEHMLINLWNRLSQQ
jgi:hypothetical protein